jgi:hypothetical protein
MPLSDDQKAMLRLLAQREQGYDDLAALMGLSVEEVRAKVGDALAQLEKEGQEPPPAPAEPPRAEEKSPAPAEPASPPEPSLPAEPVEAESQPDKAPAAPEPEPPAARPAAKPAGGTPARPKPSLPGGGARAAIVAGIAVLVLIAVVLAVSGGGSDSGGTTTTPASGETSASTGETANTSANSKEATQAILSPVGGGDAKGVAIFGRVKNSLALQIEATGLAPTGKGQSYTIWLYQSPRKMLPLASTRVDKSGKIGAQVEVPAEVLAYLAKGTFDQINVSLTTDAALKASLAKATSEKKAPIYTGTDVLRGPITGPIVDAANK